MRVLDIPYPFHSNHMLAIDTDQWRQTSVHARMVDLFRSRIVLRDYDRTGATPALCATKLGSRETYPAQVLEEGDLGVGGVEGDARAIEVESWSSQWRGRRWILGLPTDSIVVVSRDRGESSLAVWCYGWLGIDEAGCHVDGGGSVERTGLLHALSRDGGEERM